MMFWISAVFAVALAVLHAARTGQQHQQHGRLELVAHATVSMTLVSLTVGLLERARLGSPFLWIHWFILVSVIGGAIAYGCLMIRTRDSNRRRRAQLQRASQEIADWLAEVEELDPCENPDCNRIRAEMAELGADLKRR